MDIRIVMGVVVVLFGYLAIFSEGDQSINILEKLDGLSNASAEVEEPAMEEEADS